MRASLPLAVAAVAILLVAGCGRRAVSPVPPPAAPIAPAERRALAALPAPYRQADLYDGQAGFAACRACHTIDRGEPAAYGPNLWGVFGRVSGTAPGFAYSPGLKALGVVWTADTINSWIANPRAVVPGTRMTFAGVEDARERIDIVAYLKVATSPKQTPPARGPAAR